MKKIGLAVITALVLGFGMSGCGLFTTSDISTSDVKSASCKDLQDITMLNIKKAEYYYLQNEEKRTVSALSSKKFQETFGIKILDYNNGKMESTRFTERKDGLPEVFYCDKIEFLNTISTESKIFGINENKTDDSGVKVIKEIYNTQKVKEGKIVAKDIKITAYRLEPIKAVKYKGAIYPEGSTTYDNIKNLRDKLVCLEISGRKYCDGDLVKHSDNDTLILMVKANETKDGKEARVFVYGDGRAQYEASQYNNILKDESSYIVGNHNLKEYDMSNIYTLTLREVKTFKEW